MKPLFEYREELLPLLRDYHARGLVSLRKHPDHTLWVASYTPAVQYSRAWDDITLQTRCIMIDESGLVAKSFNKFFNVGEVEFHPGSYFVADKVDGSLILAAQYKGELVVASKSSFTSEHANEASRLLEGSATHPYGTTFELTHPNYRIVIDYGGNPCLTYLGGVLDPRAQFAEVHEPTWHRFIPPNISAMKFDNEQSVYDFVRDQTDVEGYVLTSIFTHNGEVFKYKAKTPWYLERHRIIFGLSPTRIFEVAKSGQAHEFVMSLPDELQEGVEQQIKEFQSQFVEVKKMAEELANMHRKNSWDRKQYASYVTKEPKELQGMLFAAFTDGVVPDDYVWKTIAP